MPAHRLSLLPRFDNPHPPCQKAQVIIMFVAIRITQYNGRVNLRAAQTAQFQTGLVINILKTLNTTGLSYVPPSRL